MNIYILVLKGADHGLAEFKSLSKQTKAQDHG